MILSLLCLALSIACFSISQLALHGKLKWTKDQYGFWGSKSDIRKYDFNFNMGRLPSKNNWYTRLFDIRFKERWLTSTWLTVFATDGYHHMQFWMFNFISLAFNFAVGWNWWIFGGLMIGVRVIHGTIYKFLQR